MTNLGTKYNGHALVSWVKYADNEFMQKLQNPQNTEAALRAAFGPGFQAGGPSNETLRIIANQQRPSAYYS